jgi:hypothetical protein
MICPGAKTCGIDLCIHYKEHPHRESCNNGCFGNIGCVKEKSYEPMRNVRSEVQTKS